MKGKQLQIGNRFIHTQCINENVKKKAKLGILCGKK